MNRWVLATSLPLAILLGSGLALADTNTSLNMYGAAGLIDMPSGEARPDGELSVTTAHFGATSRTTLSFQVTPRISASFRFLQLRNFEASAGPDPFVTFYDRSFDFRFKLLNESRYLPAVTIGFQDFAGTGVLSGEYLAATKNLGSNLKLTAGLGWGRLGSYQSIGSPFGARPARAGSFGGDFNYEQWFRGPAAPFAGVEWKANEAWTIKAEYSSDAYIRETGAGLLNHKSPFNFGVEYSPSKYYRLGAYYMYGSKVGFGAQFFLNPKSSPVGGVAGPAPNPVKPRPARTAKPSDWTTDWVSQDGAAQILRGNIAGRLKQDGILVESIGYTADRVQVRIRSTRLDSNAQAIGRVARVLSQTMPASVETFEIVPVAEGMDSARVIIRRSDLEALEFSPQAISQMRARTVVADAGGMLPRLASDPEIYPGFTWSLAPYLRYRFFDLNSPWKADVGAELSARYEIAPGLTISGKLQQKLVGNLDDRPRAIPNRARLQPVRSAVYYYDAGGSTSLDRLTVNWNAKLSPSLYSRVTVGYLERMFGGVSTEVLWKPAGSKLAFGAEVNYVKQRAPDGGFGFALPGQMYQTNTNPATGPTSYSTVSGHISAYYEFGDGFLAQLDVGRYLAGDVGATISLDREFDNGWKIGGFMTKTNVSSADFGSGSFDKGIRVTIPMAWLTGKPTQRSTSTTLRPFRRDGGARVEVDGRLYDTVRNNHESGIKDQFGRFWK